MGMLKDVAIAQMNFSNAMYQLSGYETKTTFYQDFSIADKFGVEAVLDTYKTAFNSWKTNIVYLTELSLVLNHKIWEHHNAKNEALVKCYDKIWRELDTWCVENLEGDDADYYFRITD